MSRLYFLDIAEFSSYLSLQASKKVFDYKALKVLSETVRGHSALFQRAQGQEKEVCEKKLKGLIVLLKERANQLPSHKESTKTHLIATAQLIDLK
jgi:hypothetical protein